jgi:ABC-type nitrate/sulfonate/bicarbonate transport system permease component
MKARLARTLRRSGGRILAVVIPLLILTLWQVIASLAHSIYFPPLGEIFAVFGSSWGASETASRLVPSLARLGAGFTVATVTGIVAGISLGRWTAMRAILSPVIDFCRAIPAPALLPAAIVFLGIGNVMKVFVIAFVCLWPVLLNAIDGSRGADQVMVDTARTYRLPRGTLLWRIILPSAAPQIFAGLRTSMSLGLIMVIISEMVASTNGLGHFVLISEQTFAIPEMWSGIIVLGLLGYVLNMLLLAVQRVSLRWRSAERPGEGT